MSRISSYLGSVAWFVVAPGSVCGAVPWLITRWQLPEPSPLTAGIAGFALVLVGAGVLVRAFAAFARDGRGTPAPIAPTEQLVVRGEYRYVRNPMYLGVFAAILGQALLFWSGLLLVYLAAVAVVTNLFVRVYEEPTLARDFGDSYARYVAEVPRWIPRVKPFDFLEA